MHQQLPTRVLEAVERTIGTAYVEVKNATEFDANKAVAAELGADTEVPYPIKVQDKDTNFCDIVFSSRNEPDVWIEAKIVWRCMRNTQPGVENRNYDKHLFKSSVNDVTERLMPLLQSGKAKTVGFLLTVFDSDVLKVPENDVRAFVRQAGLDGPEWSADSRRAWPNSQNDRISIRAYYWQRSQF